MPASTWRRRSVCQAVRSSAGVSPSTLGGERAAEQEALRVVAADHPQRLELGRRLEPFGHRGEPERVRERDDRLDDARVFVVAPEPVDEAAVDLERRHREPLQVAERRVAGAEVVDADVHAEIAQRAQRVRGRRRVLHQRVLGDLQAHRVRVDARLVRGSRATVSASVGSASWRGERLTFIASRRASVAPGRARPASGPAGGTRSRAPTRRSAR